MNALKHKKSSKFRQQNILQPSLRELVVDKLCPLGLVLPSNAPCRAFQPLYAQGNSTLAERLGQVPEKRIIKGRPFRVGFDRSLQRLQRRVTCPGVVQETRLVVRFVVFAPGCFMAGVSMGGIMFYRRTEWLVRRNRMSRCRSSLCRRRFSWAGRREPYLLTNWKIHCGPAGAGSFDRIT
jgi:hypothetical protein